MCLLFSLVWIGRQWVIFQNMWLALARLGLSSRLAPLNLFSFHLPMNSSPEKTLKFCAQAKCRETGEIVAIKKVLQDKRYKNRELQIMQMLDHPNIVSLKHCFFSTSDKEEVYLNLVLEFVPETVYRIARNYSRINQRMPLIYVKLYTYQVWNSLIQLFSSVMFPVSLISVAWILSP